MAFDHEGLDVYRLSLDFLSYADGVVRELPRGKGHFSDQLQRASLSILLNIAEGAGKYSPPDKGSFYARARGSATESAALLDGCERLNLISEETRNEGKKILERITRMLTNLIKSLSS